MAGRRQGKKDLIAPMVFTGSLNAEGFEGWLSLYLLPSLTEPSILILWIVHRFIEKQPSENW